MGVPEAKGRVFLERHTSNRIFWRIKMKLPSSTATDLNKQDLRHMVGMKDFTTKEMDDMMKLMHLLKEARKENAVPQLFKNKSVGMIFEAGSTRTRISFEVAATLLGGHALFL